MREVDSRFDTIWRAGDFTGPNKPSGRVTVQTPKMRLETFGMMTTFRRVPVQLGVTPSFNPYPSGIDPTKGDPCTNTYADYIFSAPAKPVEMPNVKSITWTRSTDADVAECSIEFWNTAPLPIGEVPLKGDLDQPGFYSMGRGSTTFASRWGHTRNNWTDKLIPDNILRTFEGWGTDNPAGVGIDGPGYVPPEKDKKLVQTGVWMIDEITMSTSGTIVATCRDLGRLLLDHQSMIPVVPEDFYPSSFRDWSDKVIVQSERTLVSTGVRNERLNVWHVGSGNDRWPESAYVGAKVHGHSSTHAFDGDPNTYWLSVGNDTPAYRSAYEYVDIGVANGTVSEVHFSTVKTGYNAYVSVQVNGAWIGSEIMPYRRDGRGRYDEGIPYIAYKGGIGNENDNVISFGPHENVTLVRLWLGNVQNFNLPGVKFRAALREVALFGPKPFEDRRVITEANEVNLRPGPAGSNPGHVQDFTDIIKLLCGWAGLYWPEDGYFIHSDGEVVGLRPDRPDSSVLGAPVPGRIWGDFQETGAAPPNEITAATFDKKSLMDGVRYVAEIVGFLFHIDETGAVVWRMSNVWSRGNWVGGMAVNPGRTDQVITVDERQVIFGLTAKVNSRGVREGIFVANPTGKYASITGGYNPNPTGLRRIAGWTDQNFASADEARVMADLIAVRQLFTFREDQIDIPAHPAIQIDDQIRVFERVTSEGYYHYVKGIQSTNDLSTGQWTYSLQTHWLGDDPEANWVFDRGNLSAVTRQYIDSLLGGPAFTRAGKEG